MGDRFGLPDLGVGVGLRTVHFAHILSEEPEVDFYEALTENFLDTGGRPLHILDRVAERTPVVLHGVSMSIGGTDRLDLDYLRKVKALADRTKAVWVSDHLCFTGVMGRNTHDLLPLPYTEETLRHVTKRVRTVSDVLERPLVLENPSTYLAFRASTMPEWTFFRRLLEDADCGMLLDVNNVYVSAFNHGFDAVEYIEAIPRRTGRPVPPRGPHGQGDAPPRHPQRARQGRGLDPLPPRDGPHGPARDAPANGTRTSRTSRPCTRRRKRRSRTGRRSRASRSGRPPMPDLRALERWVQAVIVHPGTVDDAIRDRSATRHVPRREAERTILPSRTMAPLERLAVYQGMYPLRMHDALAADYPGLKAFLGDHLFEHFAADYVAVHPSRSYTLNRLGDAVPAFVRGRGTTRSGRSSRTSHASSSRSRRPSTPTRTAALRRPRPRSSTPTGRAAVSASRRRSAS